LSTKGRYTIVSKQKNGRLAILHPFVMFVRLARLAVRPATFLLPGATLLLIADATPAQDTVYIGGSGQLGVEINLGVLENRAPPRHVSTTVLQHPDIDRGGLPPVNLRPPPEKTNYAARINKPDKKIIKTEAIDTNDMPALKLKAPELEAAIEAVSEAESTPKLTPTADKPVEETRVEGYTAASKQNSDKVSSASIADEATPTATSQTKPTAKLKTAPKVAETKVVAVDAIKVPNAPGDAMQILFTADNSVLPQGAQAKLAAVAKRLSQDKMLRLQLKAYAGGGADAASRARRLSLSRALSVRSKLIEQGVRSTRIDVRALGNKSENGASDRVDVILVKR